VLAVYDLPPKILLSKDSYGPASSQEDACSGDNPLAQGSEEDEEVERTESRVDTLPRLQGLSTPSLANAIGTSIRSRNPEVAAILVTRTVHGRSIGHPADTVPGSAVDSALLPSGYAAFGEGMPPSARTGFR
jgi:hypothetical protein